MSVPLKMKYVDLTDSFYGESIKTVSWPLLIAHFVLPAHWMEILESGLASQLASV